MFYCNDLRKIGSAKIFQTKDLEVKIFIPKRIASCGEHSLLVLRSLLLLSNLYFYFTGLGGTHTPTISRLDCAGWGGLGLDRILSVVSVGESSAVRFANTPPFAMK